MTEYWTFMVSDRRFGSKGVISRYYDETFIITTKGTWVPARDAKWLETIKWKCPQCGDRVKVFGKGNPTAKQMALRPTRRPKSKAKPKTTRTRSSRSGKSVSRKTTEDSE